MTKGKGINPSSRAGKSLNIIKEIGTRISLFFSGIMSKIGFSRQLSHEKRTRNFGIWGAALLIVLIVLVFITIKFQSQSPGPVAPNALQKETAELSDKFNKIKLLAAYNNRTEALREIGLLYSDLTKLSQKHELPESLLELRKQVVDELSNITSAKLISNLEKVAEWGDKPFIAGGKDTALVAESSKATTIPGSIDIDLYAFTKVIGLSMDVESGTVMVNTQKGMKNIAGSKVGSAQLSAGSWTNSGIFTVFDNNIYVLDKESGKILKYTYLKDKYSEAEDYGSPEGDEIKKAVGIAVNGSVLVLMDDGSIKKFSKSARTKIAYSDLPDANFIYKPIGIYANGDKSTIIIAHKDLWANDLTRITVLTRIGKYKKSFLLPVSMTNIKSLNYNAKDSKLWVVTDNAIYKTNIEE